MPSNNPLPQLPFMLAGVPRAVVELLREAGVPTAALPRMPLLLQETGRFVLFNSKNSASARRAERAKGQGLEVIDVAAFDAGLLLGQLKSEVESRGGVWLRLADYPFPFQGAICAAVEHASASPREFRDFVAGVPCGLTHFVPSDWDLATLLPLSKQQVNEFGWLLGSEQAGDREAEAGGTAEWKQKLRQFRAAGYAVRGLGVSPSAAKYPLTADLWSLGFRYCLTVGRKSSCRAQVNTSGVWRPEWLRFEALSATMEERHTPAPIAAQVVSDSGTLLSVVPPQEHEAQIGQRLRRQYQAGLPILLRETAEQWEATAAWVRRACSDRRLPLLWQATFAEFARWRRSRKTAAVRVWRIGSSYEIEAAGELAKFPAAVELWRGDHVATLPLAQARISLREDGIVFSQSPRNAAGLAAWGPGTFPPTTRKNQQMEAI